MLQNASPEKLASPDLLPAQLMATGQKQIDELVKMQTELFDGLQETNQQWGDRAKSEADLASEFAAKLSAARSIPEAMTACEEWSSRRFEMMVEDGKHLLADSQKFMETGARLLSTGWPTRKGNGSTQPQKEPASLEAFHLVAARAASLINQTNASVYQESSL